jgi:hypothetical protein
VHVYDESIVTSVVPVGPFPLVTSFGAEFLAELGRLSPEERLERFSRKRPPKT